MKFTSRHKIHRLSNCDFNQNRFERALSSIELLRHVTVYLKIFSRLVYGIFFRVICIANWIQSHAPNTSITTFNKKNFFNEKQLGTDQQFASVEHLFNSFTALIFTFQHIFNRIPFTRAPFVYYLKRVFVFFLPFRFLLFAMLETRSRRCKTLAFHRFNGKHRWNYVQSIFFWQGFQLYTNFVAVIAFLFDTSVLKTEFSVYGICRWKSEKLKMNWIAYIWMVVV